MFQCLAFSREEARKRFGFLLDALSSGTPPHGGIALGFDRHIMLLAGETSLKEAIAFPMTSTGRTAVMDAPSLLDPAQLAELGIGVIDRS